MPALKRISLRVEGVQRSVAHLDAFRVDLLARVGFFERVVPSIADVLAVGLGLAGPGEAEFLVGACLDTSLSEES